MCVRKATREGDGTTKCCSRCGEVKPRSEFNVHKGRGDGVQPYCRDCWQAYWRQHYQDRGYDRYLARTYGLERGEYAQILDAQGGVCAICHQPETATMPNGTVKKLAVDHDHDREGREAVRALLCVRCNSLIEALETSGGLLADAIAYLRERGSSADLAELRAVLM